uniref:Uncharacterized protein n=1 Tax=viral metagenome TaxID=1070528 RepID=A0A6M3IHI3_9ZZZZ
MSVKQKWSQRGNDAEDALIRNIDARNFAKRYGKELAFKLRKIISDKLSAKDLKKTAGEIRLEYVVLKFAEALEDGELKQVEFYGGKIEEYCIAKPKDVGGPLEDGLANLMEVVAMQLAAKRVTDGRD